MEEQCSQGSFIPRGREDILTTAIGRPEHPGRVRGEGAGVGLRSYFGPSQKQKGTCMSQEELAQLEQTIAARLTPSIAAQLTPAITAHVEEEMRKLFGASIASMAGSQQQDVVPPSDQAPVVTRASTKGSCAGDSRVGCDNPDLVQLLVQEEGAEPRVVALGCVIDGASTIHGVPLKPNLAKVVVEEIRDGDARVPVPTDEVTVVGQALDTFIA